MLTAPHHASAGQQAQHSRVAGAEHCLATSADILTLAPSPSRCCSYIHTAAYGHFGRNDRPDVFTWEKVVPLKVRPLWFFGGGSTLSPALASLGNRAHSDTCLLACPAGLKRGLCPVFCLQDA